MPSILLKQTPQTGQMMRGLADELVRRMYNGKIVIVVDCPARYIGPLRKRWLRMARRVRIERASTLDSGKIAELEFVERYMRGMRFTLRYPPDKYFGNVYLVGVKEALKWPPECSTMFILGKVESHEKYLLTAWMRSYSLVVLYEDWK
jgi:hypothetical protein